METLKPGKAQIDGVTVDEFDWRMIPKMARHNTKVVPDRLSVEPASEWFCPIYIRRIGVKLNGVVQTRVIEYCISEGWVRLHVNTKHKVKVSAKGRVVAFKKQGKVVAYLQDFPKEAEAAEVLPLSQEGELPQTGDDSE